MHPFPHHYHARAEGGAGGAVRVSTEAAPDLQTNAPPEFDGPPGYWSPESLLVASVADCFILSFRAVARASKLEWRSLSVDVEGVLERVDGVTRFVSFTVVPRLSICAADREHLAGSVLDKAKRTCLVTNSLNAECHLAPQVSVVACEGTVAAA
jgi:organic hydroperoxide reductase OsmC/OhrA